MNAQQLKKYILRPVFEDLGVCSDSAINLAVMTSIPESEGGEYIHQLGGGPAVGIFEMEPRTHDDIWNNYLEYRQDLAKKVKRWRCDAMAKAGQMAGNNYYAAAMLRVHYLRVPEALPAADDIEGLARYYKKYWNTAGGASTIDATVAEYNEYVKG